MTDIPADHFDQDAIAAIRKPGSPVVIPPAATEQMADGTPLANGETRTLAGVQVETIPMYDLIPGEPVHPKGRGNGYLLTLGGRRVYVAGVTECVPEVRALRDIEVVFVPMNLPQGRMTPAAAAECVRDIDPAVGGLDQVQLYDIDALQMVSESPAAGMQQDVDQAEAIVNEKTIQFREWWDSLDVVPLIAAIRKQAEEIRRDEVAKTVSKIKSQWPDDPEQMAEYLDAMTSALVKKLLHQPTVFFKENRDPDRRQLARQFFNLDGGTRRRGQK